MPFYEFTCGECGHRFSKRSSWADKKTIHCPKCDGDKLKELYGLNYVSPASGKKRAPAASRPACGGGFG